MASRSDDGPGARLPEGRAPTEKELSTRFRKELEDRLTRAEAATTGESRLDLLIRQYCYLRGERHEIWRTQMALLQQVSADVDQLSIRVEELAAVRPRTPGFEEVAWPAGAEEVLPSLDRLRSWVDGQLRERESLLAQTAEMRASRQEVVRAEMAKGANAKRAIAAAEKETGTSLDMAALDLPDPDENAWAPAFILRCAEHHFLPTEMAKVEFLATRTQWARDLGFMPVKFESRQNAWAKAMKRYGLPAAEFKEATLREEASREEAVRKKST